MALIDWLQNTPVSLTIANVIWIVPLVQTIHIICIAAVMGSIVLLDLRVLDLGVRSLSIAAAARRFLPWLWSALALLLLTGIILVVGDPVLALTSQVFFIKMGLVVAAALVSLQLQRSLRVRPESGTFTRLLAGLSLALWVAIVFAGRWIAYA